MVVSSATIDSLLKEKEQYPPPESFRRQAVVRDPKILTDAEKDPEKFWADQAKELRWSKPWDKVLEWDPPFAKWFVGGTINVSENCLDRHVTSARRNKAAIVWEGESGERRVFTYHHLWREVNKFANVLRSLGVKRGDRVTIYMPMIPELPIAMLACARIGAPHSVIFGGFSSKAVQDRVADAESHVIVTADAGYRRGAPVLLKKAVDEAVEGLPVVRHVVVYKRAGIEVTMKEGRDVWWHEAMAKADDWCPPEPMGAADPLFILYTSGTTGKPKGVVHSTAGYLVGVAATTKLIFDLKEDDFYWCTADIGWVTGHSYIVYGPLATGATSFMFEGVPDYPKPNRWWQLVEEYGVTILYTAPTAIRACMRWGEDWPKMHDLSSLRLLGTVGEPINPEAWRWYYRTIGGSRCPIVDTWWQTETGMVLITPLPGIATLKPGSATRPFPGVAAEVVDEKGHTVGAGRGGYLVISRPWPAMLMTLYKDPERYKATYWSQVPGKYFTGDGARLDEDSYFWLMGRIDDVINISGHRVGTMEVESALVSHPKVAEAAVVGKPHALKGQALVAYVVLRTGEERSEPLKDELKKHVRAEIGPIAAPDEIYITEKLPKTRSGKIMRRVIRALVSGQEIGDTTTLEDPGAVEEVKKWLEAVEGKAP
ncbi:MAG: acetate--CoA ligase [Euryarchaeota archaeon RBG_19FT_COMBO_69_17]|nr:MAG: acetate--CoA ligase [Euryarchaeota archaeon RBG_19FT_COMBO_69_17]